MTDCPNVEMRERLPDLLHGRLEGAARVEVQAHLATCEACAAELAVLREARRVLDRAPAIDVARIVAALPRPGAAPPLTVSRGGRVAPVIGPRPVPAWRRYAAAAALLLAAGVGAYPLLRGADAGGLSEPGVLAGVTATVAPTATGPASDDRLLAVNVEGLSDDDFVGLLDALDDLEAVPASDPLPLVPVEASVGGGD